MRGGPGIWEDSGRCQAGADVCLVYGHGLGVYVLACSDCVSIMRVLIWLVFRHKSLYMGDLPVSFVCIDKPVDHGYCVDEVVRAQ